VEHDPTPRPDQDPLEELDGTLRRAVAAVRAAPIPRDARDRAVERARRVGPRAAADRMRRRTYLAVAGVIAVAAAVILTIALRPELVLRLLSPADQPRMFAIEDTGAGPPKRGEPGWQDDTGGRGPAPEEADLLKDAKPRSSLEGRGEEKGPGVADPRKADPDEGKPHGGKGSKGDGKDKGTDGVRFKDSRPEPTGRGPSTTGTVAPGFGGMPGGPGGRLDRPREAPGMPGMPGRPGMPGGPGMPGMPGGAAKPAEPTGPLMRNAPAPAGAPGRKEIGDERTRNVLPVTVPPAAPTAPESAELERRAREMQEAGKKSLQLRGGADRSGEALDKTKRDSKGEDDEKFYSRTEKGATRTWHEGGGPPTFARVYVGDGNSLELVSLQVSVTVEGPRARTVVDHIFRNPHPRQLEGTFEYPLPTGASPSYFAMFVGQTTGPAPPRLAGGGAPALPERMRDQIAPADFAKAVSTADWGRLHEARVVAREKALEAYEDTVRGNIDPALLEYAGGNSFSGRVFPIPAKGYNRVIFAYEELLPYTQDRLVYRFPLPGRTLTEMQFTLQANLAECRDAVFLPKDAETREGGGQLVYRRTWKDMKPAGAVEFAFRPPRLDVQAASGRRGENGPRYLYARLRPDLKVESAKPFADRAVFLLDTSLSEQGDRFGVNVKLLRKILEDDPGIRRFNVLTFNAAPAWIEPAGWLPNTAEGRKKLFARLDGIVLEGATDLSAALDQLASARFDGLTDGAALEVFLLSDGQVTWGESDINTLVARFEARCPCATRFQCYRVGLGAENLELFEALTRRGGGIFNCFTPDQLPAAARAHRTQCLQVERVRFVGGPAASDVLVAGRKAAVYPDGELIVAGRFRGPERTTLVVEGTFLGKKVAQEYPLEVRDQGELAARGWGEIAVASLLALNDPKLDDLVTAYCQEFGIASRVASFLILENDNEYKRLGLEAERGKTVRGDLGQYLETMWQSLSKVVPPKEAVVQFLGRIDGRLQLSNGANAPHVRNLLVVLSDKDFELPEAQLKGAILHRLDVPPTYLSERDKDVRVVDTYLREAKRRAGDGDVDGAVRVLSSVIEEYPQRGDALRLVGYRLLDLHQPAHAARLFRQVQRNRPFEPHSYRDFARSLEESGRFGLAALQYEVLLAGTWHNRFRDSLKQVALEEYARMMQDAIRQKTVSRDLADFFGERLERLAVPQPKSDLRVTISWNTDATDVDLWVIEPDGTKCFYQNTRTKNGGELSQDQTQGYGPERYQIAKAPKGVYTIIVHYYRANQNLLTGESHVNVVITRHAGTPQETTTRKTVILKRQDEQVEVSREEF
jgi:hypothetical protein